MRRSILFSIGLPLAYAWTTPAVVRGGQWRSPRLAASSSALGAATLSAPFNLETTASTTTDKHHTVTPHENHNDEHMRHSLLGLAQSRSNVNVEEMTHIFLSPHVHPPGTLSWDVLDSSYSILHGWSKTNCLEGAKTAHAILHRLMQEEDYTDDERLVTSKHFGMVVDGYCHADDPHAAEAVLSEMKEAPNRILLNTILSVICTTGRFT